MIKINWGALPELCLLNDIDDGIENVPNVAFPCRLYNGKAAENELKQMTSDQHTFGQDLVKHNLVVFRNGEGALKVTEDAYLVWL